MGRKGRIDRRAVGYDRTRRAPLTDTRGRPPAAVFLDTSGRFEIRAPDPGFFGVRGGCQFIAGVARSDSAERAAALAEAGFTVTEESQP